MQYFALFFSFLLLALKYQIPVILAMEGGVESKGILFSPPTPNCQAQDSRETTRPLLRLQGKILIPCFQYVLDNTHTIVVVRLGTKINLLQSRVFFYLCFLLPMHDPEGTNSLITKSHNHHPIVNAMTLFLSRQVQHQKYSLHCCAHLSTCLR